MKKQTLEKQTDDPYATVPQIASALLKVDMKAQIREMDSFRNRLRTFLTFKLPTRNNRAAHFAENCSAEFRSKHPLSLPFQSSPRTTA